MGDEAAARLALHEHMQRHVSDAAWAALVADGRLADWRVVRGTANEAVALDEMAKKVASFEAAAAEPAERRNSEAPDQADRRFVIVSELCVMDARERQDVQQFRADVLEDGLLDLDAMDMWITARAPADVTPRTLITIDLPPGHRVVEEPVRAGRQWHVEPPLLLDEIMTATHRDGSVVATGPAVRISAPQKHLAWPNPKRGGVNRTAVCDQTPLGRLRDLAGTLADDYGWSEPAAVAFVLTDAVPPIARLTVAPHVHGLGGRGRGRVRREVVIQADAWATPAEVAASFAAARRELGINRAFTVHGKSARLIEFVAQLDAGMSWRAKMQHWNAAGAAGALEHYVDARRFARDIRRARDRLGAVVQMGRLAGEDRASGRRGRRH